MDGIDTRTADLVGVVVTVGGRRIEGPLGTITLYVRWEVREEITEALFAGRQSGEIDCGGQRYEWFVAD